MTKKRQLKPREAGSRKVGFGKENVYRTPKVKHSKKEDKPDGSDQA